MSDPTFRDGLLCAVLRAEEEKAALRAQVKMLREALMMARGKIRHSEWPMADGEISRVLAATEPSERWADRPQTFIELLHAVEGERDALRSENKKAYRYASNFACSFIAKHFPDNKQWFPHGDLLGLLTQIDNAMTIADNLAAERDALRVQVETLRKAVLPSGSFGRSDDGT